MNTIAGLVIFSVLAALIIVATIFGLVALMSWVFKRIGEVEEVDVAPRHRAEDKDLLEV